MSGRDGTEPTEAVHGELLPEGEEAPPPGTRGMAVVRWALVALTALAAAGAWVYHANTGAGIGREAAASYRCPMHPSVVQERPGACPICGMDLVAARRAGERAKQAGGGEKPDPASAAGTAGKFWCPMHPEVASDDPEATCPKCGGMKLVPRPAARAEGGAGAPGLVPLEISTERTQLMGLRTAKATRGPLAPQLRAFGFVSANERSVSIVTARASGWVEALRIAQIGQRVEKGEVLLTLYSGEVVAAQQAYLDATRWKRNLAATNPGGLPPAAQAVDRDSLRRLQLYGVAKEDIEAIEKRAEPLAAVPIRAPRAGYVARKNVLPGQYVAAATDLYQIADLSTVWVVADLFEQDMDRVAVGQRARFVPASSPGISFPGRVEFIYPAVNPETRTLQARLEFRNPGLKLRPGAFGDVIIEGAASSGITVPSEAVVDTGEMHYVFVALPGGRFEPRVVQPGMVGESRIEILAGVREGEAVVTTASFLLDSESRLRATVEAHSAGVGDAPAR